MITWRCWSKTLSALLATSKIVTFATRLNTSQGRINKENGIAARKPFPTCEHQCGLAFMTENGRGNYKLVIRRATRRVAGCGWAEFAIQSKRTVVDRTLHHRILAAGTEAWMTSPSHDDGFTYTVSPTSRWTDGATCTARFTLFS